MRFKIGLLLCLFITGCSGTPVSLQQAPPEQETPPENQPSISSGCGGFSFDNAPIDIGGGLPSGYEPSGVDWHERLGKLFLVGDGGTVSTMNQDGTAITNWSVPGDLEGITIPDPQTNFVYLGVEHPDGILEFDISTARTTRSFNLTPWMQGANNQGLEALTFVADSGNPEGGLFYAGHQGEGKIYVFQLPIKSSSTSTTVTFIRSFAPVPGRGDLADMDYDPATNLIYAIFDGANKLTAINPSGTVVEEWNLPHDDQEGFTRNSSCDFVVAQDTGKKVWFYQGSLPPIVINAPILNKLSDRVAQVQNDDGSFDWQQPVSDPLTPTVTGFQNVTGITALGFFGAMELLENSTWQSNLDRTADYFETRLDLLLANPADLNSSLSCPNWTFLSWYLQKNPDTALEDKTINGFNALLNARNTTYGNDPSIRVDGLLNRIIVGRASIPGIIPWDLSLCVEALEAMAQISADFETDYETSLDLMVNQLNLSFEPAYKANPQLQYADISLALPLYVLAKSPASNLYAATINNLSSQLMALIDSAGLISNGSPNDDPLQATVYGLLALKQIGNAYAQKVQTYLESQVDAQGIIKDPANNLETYEVEGEALRALSFVRP